MSAEDLYTVNLFIIMATNFYFADATLLFVVIKGAKSLQNLLMPNGNNIQAVWPAYSLFAIKV